MEAPALPIIEKLNLLTPSTFTMKSALLTDFELFLVRCLSKASYFTHWRINYTNFNLKLHLMRDEPIEMLVDFTFWLAHIHHTLCPFFAKAMLFYSIPHSFCV